ncbi:hypothetical protein JTE90_015431 [Oedothorax gibbosus]|uniref:Uncharacterized protein n=1 Tax=Oedothorax gibbosus TaxID=931172 RepID=A0AAV6TPV4_9ARAC|nr:hypothetical protein JTE90_015431 [Oedothorax gibbosus]
MLHHGKACPSRFLGVDVNHRKDVGSSSERRRIIIGKTSDHHRKDVGSSSERRRVIIGKTSDHHRKYVGSSSEIRRIIINRTTDVKDPRLLRMRYFVILKRKR